MKLTFYPDHDGTLLEKAAKEYQSLWDAEGEKITSAIEKATKLTFIEKLINVTVFEGTSHSHPLALRASYSTDQKKGALIHELCHRLMFANKVKFPDKNEDMGLASHKQVNLVLYDIWTDLYGEVFAKEQVGIESQRQPFYADAWQWALDLSREDRQKLLSSLMK